MIARLPGSSDAGFTLIEVLVAFAIVSLCLASLYSALAAHSSQIAVTDMHRQTLAFARTHLESFGEALPAEGGATTGRYPNGMRWQLSVRAISADGATDSPARPYFVLLEVFDRSGHSVIVLSSIKMLAAGQ
jgi:general secretion pathway protein I